MPVLKPNEAMIEQAAARGSWIGLLSTFEPTLASMAAAGGSVDLRDGLSRQFRVQCAHQKYFASPFGGNRSVDSAMRIAIVTDAGRDAVDAAAFCARRVVCKIK